MKYLITLYRSTPVIPRKGQIHTSTAAYLSTVVVEGHNDGEAKEILMNYAKRKYGLAPENVSYIVQSKSPESVFEIEDGLHLADFKRPSRRR